MQRGVIIKPWLESGFDTFIRVTVGTAEGSDRFLLALEQAMDSLHATRHR